jgi:hypothetical protein
VLEVDKNGQVTVIMAINPNSSFTDNILRLIDKRRKQPEIWNYVFHKVGDRTQKGQFTLTGLVNPDVKHLHSEAGGFTIVQMDVSKISGVKRDTRKVQALLCSLSRNIATLVGNSTVDFIDKAA